MWPPAARRDRSRSSSSQEMLDRPPAAKRFVQNVFPAPDIPQGDGEGEESWLTMRTVSARAPAIEQVLPVQGTPTNVAEVRSSSQKEELDGNIFFP